MKKTSFKRERLIKKMLKFLPDTDIKAELTGFYIKDNIIKVTDSYRLAVVKLETRLSEGIYNLKNLELITDCKYPDTANGVEFEPDNGDYEIYNLNSLRDKIISNNNLTQLNRYYYKSEFLLESLDLLQEYCNIDNDYNIKLSINHRGLLKLSNHNNGIQIYIMCRYV